MSLRSVLFPVLIEVGLIFVLLAAMAAARQRAFRNGLSLQKIALSGDAYPPQARQLANCYANQFEMPVLFFFAVIFGIVLHHTGWLFVVAEWAFVACRVAHAVIHTSSNIVMARGVTFLGSAAAVGLMWALIFVGVYLAPSFA